MKNEINEKELEYLAHKWRTGKMSDQERNRFDAWYDAHLDELAVLDGEGLDATQVKKNMHDKIMLRIGIKDREQTRVKILGVKRSAFMAAAVVALLAGFLLLFIKLKDSTSLNKDDVAQPGKNVAILTLSDGKQITLDGEHDGKLATEPGVTITKTRDGEVVYTINESQNNKALSFNTITTPNGGQYRILMPDGTRVALNAASSLKFPSTFNATALRKVELTGEAYFEVAKNPDKPFVVRTPQQEVRVLGTHFNINCYKDEPVVKTTLLEGSVRVNPVGSADFSILQPGQQAVLQSQQLLVQRVDTEAEVAWKDGKFIFTGQDLKTVMRMLSRWYNIEVKYQFVPSDHLGFEGQVSRSRSLPAVLKMLQETGEFDVKFQLKGREVTISR